MFNGNEDSDEISNKKSDKINLENDRSFAYNYEFEYTPDYKMD